MRFVSPSTLVFALVLFLLPWLDVSPVKSIRYKGPLFKTALTLFVIVFLVLGYYGTQSVTYNAYRNTFAPFYDLAATQGVRGAEQRLRPAITKDCAAAR